MRYDLAGRTILAAGAARGIGAELARRAAARGARLALVWLEPDLLKQLAADLDAHRYECDVTDQAALGAAVASTVDQMEDEVRRLGRSFGRKSVGGKP